MRKIFFCLTFILFSQALRSQQDSTSFEKLFQNFKKIYFEFYDTKKETFYTSLNSATKYAIHVLSPVFMATIEEFEARNSLKESKEVVCHKITDSIFTRILSNFFWSGHETDSTRFSPVLGIFNNNFCDCITGKEDKIGTVTDFAQMSSECEKALTSNVIVMNSIRKSIAGFSYDERMKLQPLTSLYSFQHCPLFRKYTAGSIIESWKMDLSSHFQSLVFNLSDLFLDVYKKRKADSVELLFPGYKMAGLKLEGLLKINSLDPESITKINNGDSVQTTTFFTTYYKKDKKTTILGQAIWTINKTDQFNPVIKEFDFLPPDKITDSKSILKEIAEGQVLEPPPPRELIKNQ